MKVALNFEPMLLWCRPHPSLQAKSSCLNSPCIKWRCSLSSNLPPDYDKNRPQLLLRLRLSGLLSRPLKTRGTPRCLLKNASLWPLGHGTLVCAHGTTILTNCEPSRLGHRVYKKNVRLKNIFRCI